MSSALRNLRLLDAWRVPLQGDWGDETCGAFRMPGPCGMELVVIASANDGWDHVSVSTARRAPNWQEMEWVKRRFFHDDATAMQLHVPPADHISLHPHCLHIWKPHGVEVPRPPAGMVAPVAAAKARA